MLSSFKKTIIYVKSPHPLTVSWESTDQEELGWTWLCGRVTSALRQKKALATHLGQSSLTWGGEDLFSILK